METTVDSTTVLQAALDMSPDYTVAAFDDELRWLACQGAWLREWGRTEAEVIGQTLAEVVGEYGPLESALRSALGGQDASVVTSTPGVPGAPAGGGTVPGQRATRLHLLRTRATTGADGRRTVVLVAQDVTEQSRANRAAEEAEEGLRLLIDGNPDYAIFMLGPDGTVATWNAGASRIKGYLTSEIVGRHFSAFFTAEDRRRGHPAEILDQARSHGRYSEEGWRLRRDGSRFWAGATVTALRDASGRLRGYGKVTRDLTSRRASEHALWVSTTRFRAAFDEGPLAMALVEVDSQLRATITDVNAAMCRLAGRTAADLIETDLSTLDAPASTTIRDCAALALSSGGESVEAILDRRAGPPCAVAVRFTVLRDETPTAFGHGPASHLILQAEDLSAKRQTESALAELAFERATSDRLREVDRLRTDFISMVSHELRTPLASVLGNVESLSDGDAGPLTCQQLDMLGAINDNAERLRHLIENLLFLSGTDANRPPSPRAPLEVGALLRACVVTVGPLLLTRYQRFRLVVPTGEEYWTSGSAEELERVVLNLITNAIKFTPEGGHISLACAGEGRSISITVTDTGAGIPAEEVPHIFERFYRGSHSNTQEVPGSGLGLSIVRHILTEHGGGIEVRSTPGEGTVFTVTLARIPAPDGTAPW